MFYRQLQIISIQYRIIFSQFQISCVIVCCIAIQTACLYNTIIFMSGGDTGGPIWYDLMYAWTELTIFADIVFVIGILAEVNSVSEKMQKKINGRHELKKNKWLKRWIRSSPGLKIYFGESNYLEKITPLIFQDFSTRQTASLMLLQK